MNKQTCPLQVGEEVNVPLNFFEKPHEKGVAMKIRGIMEETVVYWELEVEKPNGDSGIVLARYNDAGQAIIKSAECAVVVEAK